MRSRGPRAVLPVFDPGHSEFGAGFTGYALRAEFYQAGAASLPVLGGSLLLLVIPALIAIALPARQAAHLDLVQTLRSE